MSELGRDDSEPQFLSAENVSVPEDWTILLHGSNTASRKWLRGDMDLDEDSLVVAGKWPGLSCITQEEREVEAGHGMDTTQAFASRGGMGGKPLELRIPFPAFHSRKPGLSAVKMRYEERYGLERVSGVLEFANQVHNRLSQRHPVIPLGTKLVKLVDQDGETRRVITYIPEQLMDIYLRETATSENHEVT